MGASAVAIGGLALSAVGTAVGVAGSMSSASAQAANANYQAQVARNNSIAAAQNAEYATRAGQEKATEASLKGAERLAAVTSGIAANGLDVNTGSAADVRATQRETNALETQQQVTAADLQSYGYRTQQTGFTAQAALDAAEARQAGTAGEFAAAGGLLSGASGVALSYAKLQQVGAVGGGL